MKTPKTTLLSPMGRKIFGMAAKRTNVPTRHTTQMASSEPPVLEEPGEVAAVDAARKRFSASPAVRSTHVCLAPCPRSFRRRAHMSGVSVSDTRPEAKIATTIVTANSRKIRPISPDMKTSGMKTAASEIVIETIVKLISFALASVASSGARAALHAPHGVLEEHDGVVDEEADGERQRHQREVVEAVAEEPHRDERQQQRQRQRHDRDQRVGGAAEEQEDHEHDEHERDEQRLLHVLDGVHDRARAVVDRRRRGWSRAARR